MLRNHHGIVRKQRAGAPAQHAQRGGILPFGVVGRIEKDDIELRSLCAPQKALHAACLHAEACRKSQLREIAAQHLQRRRGALHQDNLLNAAAVRFDAHGSRAGVEVQKRRPFDPRRQHVEERFAQPVAGGPRRQPRRSLQRSRSKPAADDAHGYLPG